MRHSKKAIIEYMGTRILAEHNKHQTLRWWAIAARKIYAEMEERGTIVPKPKQGR